MTDADTAEMVDAILPHYVECALWASHDERHEDNPDDYAENLDEGYDLDDLDDAALTEMRADIASFLAMVEPADLTEYLSRRADAYASDPLGQLGHDLWLTRNGHGAGFWDRGLGDLGERLTVHAKSLGSSYLYVSEEERVCIM